MSFTALRRSGDPAATTTDKTPLAVKFNAMNTATPTFTTVGEAAAGDEGAAGADASPSPAFSALAFVAPAITTTVSSPTATTRRKNGRRQAYLA